MRLRGLVALLLAGLPATGVAAGPRVMSIGLCSDQLLLALLPPDRIASVTWLARETTSPAVAAAARRVPVNRQSAEEVLRQRPALILADDFSAPATVQMIERLHLRLVKVPSARDFPTIRAVTLRVGAAVGALPRARVLAARMDAALAEIAATPLPYSPRVAAWDGTGSLPPKGTLYDAVITAAGARNVGRETAAWRGGYHSEALIASRPDLLLHDDLVLCAPGRAAELVGHPIVRKLYRDRQIVIPQEQFVCGTPAAADAALQLHRALRARSRDE